MDKIDLVIWTLNSEKSLKRVLLNAVKVIGEKNINNKILVDSGSEDNTVWIGRRLGWDVYVSKKRGIPNQANIALNHVETEFFVSIEHDLLLNKNWFNTISRYFKDKNVSVAQGIHISSNPILFKHDMWIIHDALIKNDAYGISLDNTMYRTNDIRKVGGFPNRDPISCDRELRDKVWNMNKKWIIDKEMKNIHIRDSYWCSTLHDFNMTKNVVRRYRSGATSDKLTLWGKLPFIQLYYSLRYLKEPRLIPFYVIHKIGMVLGYFRRRCLCH